MKRTLLLNSDPAEGGDNTPAPAPAPAAPPAASAVLESDAKEGDAAEIVELRRKLTETESEKRAREQRIAELEDENHRLKTPPAPAPAPRKPKSAPLTALEAFREGAD